jgi:hypothetical protein
LTPKKGRDVPQERKVQDKQLNGRRIVVEHTFGHIKNFGCLTQPWRNDLDSQYTCFWVCCQLTNMMIRSKAGSLDENSINSEEDDSESEEGEEDDSEDEEGEENDSEDEDEGFVSFPFFLKSGLCVSLPFLK